MPEEPVPELVPDLVVEALSRTNTPGEMRRKRQEYFQAGAVLVWMVAPDRRTVTVFTSPTDFAEHAERGSIDGGNVLPGFALSLAEFFQELDRRANA